MTLTQLSRAHQLHLTCQTLLPSSAWCLFAAQVGSSHLICSQLLLRSAVSDSGLIACRSVCPQTPTCFSFLVVQGPAKPLHPTPTVKTCVLQACCAASAAMSAYSTGLRSNASFKADSHGPGSLTMVWHLWEVDASIWSERCNHLWSKSFWSFQSSWAAGLILQSDLLWLGLDGFEREFHFTL